MSSGPVLQQPSRKNPVTGLIEQSSSRSPRTFRGALRRPPPFPLSSLSNANSWIAAMPANAGACRPPTSESSHADGTLPRWSIEPPPEERRLRQRGYRIGGRYGKPSTARRIRHEGSFESDLACADCANGAAGPRRRLANCSRGSAAGGERSLAHSSAERRFRASRNTAAA